MIDETLAEIEELEADVREMFTELLGPEAARKIEAYKQAQETAPRIAPLVTSGDRAEGASPQVDPDASPRRYSPEAP